MVGAGSSGLSVMRERMEVLGLALESHFPELLCLPPLLCSWGEQFHVFEADWK